MFKRKPDIRNLAPLRSSDRRKLADQIIRDYQVSIPQQSDDGPSSSSQSTLRNSLLPESTSSARFITPTEQGTVYIGAHPDQDERVLWFQTGKNPRLIPTVYTLWRNPNLIPLLHTPDFVVEEKLKHGADLMVPGLVKARGSSWDKRASTGAVVAVAGLENDTVPVWVGTCQIDVQSLPDDLRGQKGAAIKALHWAGDECWNWKSLGSGGIDPPSSLEGWNGLGAGLASQLGKVSLQDDSPAEETTSAAQPEESHEPQDEDEDQEPTTQEVDNAFRQAFLYAVHKAKQSGSPPHYGLNFPLQPSFIIANMIQPNLRSQSRHYNIKKTSWKNAKKFIKELHKQKLVLSKDRNGGETVILDIDFEDAQITGFRPYRLPTPKAPAADTGTSAADAGPSSNSSASSGQKINVQLVYRPSSKLVPTLLPSKTDFYSAQEISAAIKSYIDQHPELGGQGNSSVKLDPFIANEILGNRPTDDDRSWLAAGRITRSALQKRVLEDTHLCQPFHIISQGRPSADQKPKAGSPPRILITTEKRTGTKVVTKISNLEPFFIDPQVLAPELQKKCAGSASVGQVAGAKPGLMEVVVQGDQRKILTNDILSKKGIEMKWVDIVDKTKPKKKN
ncbi:translation machinery-associated 64 [Fusarium longipes]|uniref:Translation machinery-associated 64 n=1 Tax=Fusarium longipes TaxID=694270 RepID=A0A395T8D5_9HYPO|nr:translation machinery-associated 64 [Fusarium longipes]